MAEEKMDRDPHDTQAIHARGVNERPQSKDLAVLREKAEKELKEQTERLDEFSKQSVERLFQELGTYQTELEMQNEELRKKYSELYDFAPVSYFTFDTDGLIQKVNITGANLLGIDRYMLIKMPFYVFIADEDSKNVFHAHIEEVLKNQNLQNCEIRLKRNTGPVFDAELQSIAVDDYKREHHWVPDNGD